MPALRKRHALPPSPTAGTATEARSEPQAAKPVGAQAAPAPPLLRAQGAYNLADAGRISSSPRNVRRRLRLSSPLTGVFGLLGL